VQHPRLPQQVKKALPHGSCLACLRSKFNRIERTAHNLMAVTGDFRNLESFPICASTRPPRTCCRCRDVVQHSRDEPDSSRTWQIALFFCSVTRCFRIVFAC
jgi:hypothetical protein